MKSRKIGKYVKGQLSDLPRKSVEPIALRRVVPPRTPQALAEALAEQAGQKQGIFHCPADKPGSFSYTLSSSHAGLPITSGKADEPLVSETASRHSGGPNVLFFDGRVDQGG